MIKKYAVYGKVEFVMAITIANNSINVDFSGGSITSRGVIPATYTTNNPLLQKALEESSEFKVGIVRVISAIPEANDVRVARAKEEAEKARQEAALKTEEEAGKKEPSAVIESKSPEQTNVEVLQEGQPDEVQDTTDVQETESEVIASEGASQPKTTVNVTCREDAVEYLKANFGYTSSKLRSKGAVEKAAEQHGINFVGL